MALKVAALDDEMVALKGSMEVKMWQNDSTQSHRPQSALKHRLYPASSTAIVRSKSISDSGCMEV